VIIGPDQRFRAAADVHTRAFDGETVLVDLRRGDYYGLNELGAKLWEGVVVGRSPREIAVAVGPELQVEPERLLADLVALARDLVDRGLLLVE
jgi:hypothetical protein